MNIQEENGITKLGCVNHDCDVCKAKAKRQWVGLTDEEEIKLAQDSMGKSRHWLVAQVEAKLKEKNL